MTDINHFHTSMTIPTLIYYYHYNFLIYVKRKLVENCTFIKDLQFYLFVIICLKENHLFKEQGAYCLGHVVRGEKMVDICLAIFLRQILTQVCMPKRDQNVCFALVWGKKEKRGSKCSKCSATLRFIWQNSSATLHFIWRNCSAKQFFPFFLLNKVGKVGPSPSPIGNFQHFLTLS